MQANIDKGFVALLNKRTVLNLTWVQFVEIYKARKAERDADPEVLARRAYHRKIHDLMDEFMLDEIRGQ